MGERPTTTKLRATLGPCKNQATLSDKGEEVPESKRQLNRQQQSRGRVWALKNKLTACKPTTRGKKALEARKQTRGY